MTECPTRGHPLPEQLDALRALAAEARSAGVGLLRERWARLDESDPINQFSTVVSSSGGADAEYRTCEVEAHQITDVDGDPSGKWGVVNNRCYTYNLNMKWLGKCAAPEEFSEYLRDICGVKLLAIPGPCGPLFETGGSGRHRTHIMKALAIPRVRVSRVEFSAVLERAGDRGYAHLASDRPRYRPPLMRATATDAERETAIKEADAANQRARKRSITRREMMKAHLTGLEQRGWITDLESHRGLDYYSHSAIFTLARDLPAYWALEDPADVERLTRRYVRSYPEFAETEVGRAMCDRAAWIDYLGVEDPMVTVARRREAAQVCGLADQEANEQREPWWRRWLHADW